MTDALENQLDEMNITELSDTLSNEEPKRVVVFEEALEAILFAAGHPITYSTLARVFEMTPAKIKDKVFEYSLKYNDSEIPRGVILLTYNDSCQLCTKQHYLTEIREALGIKKSGTLSTSSMEALAIIAYNQPVTRMFVDTLRRADSSYAMGNLLDRGLIESQGRLDAPGRPMLYGTTPDFLRSFGLKSLSDLPNTSDELMQVFEKTKFSENENREENSAKDIIDPTQGKQISLEEAAETILEEADTDVNEPSADDDLGNDY